MRKLYALVSLLTLWFAAQAQYATNGTASVLGPNHFQLTPAANHSAGSVWNTTQVSLAGNFEINAQLYFGTVDDFADGIGFLLQSAGTTALGNSGAGLGYHGIAPSVVVEFDTYNNDFVSDISQDHLGFMSNGSAYHSDALQPASPLPSNPEDGQYHDVRFSWNAATKTLTVNFMSATYSYTGDIVSTHFGGNPMVYWGFTAGTGDGPNEHRVRIVSVTTGGGQTTPITITGNVTNAGCTGGSIDISVSGGTAPYSYAWSNGANTQDISNLTPGSYTVTVTDGTGTTKQATFAVGDDGCVQPITITGTVTNASCTGGAVDITVSGGVAPYSYSWSNGATTQDLGSVPAGSYTVTVTDGAGTTKQATFMVGDNGCVQPITITGSVTNAGCTGGAIDIAVSGGVTPYSYSWSNGATTQDISNVPAGNYTVTVTDGAGTTKQASFTVGNNGCVQPIIITGNVTNAGCTGGAVDITVSGGVTPYSYSWSNGATTQDLGNVPAGNYTVTVTDGAGTTKQASFTVGNNGCTTPITITGTVTNASCNSGGKIDISVSGGTSPYTYSWSNGANTEDLNNVPAGSYTVTVRDATGATKQAGFTVQSGNDNAAPQLVCPGTQTRCDNLINYHMIPELQASDNCGISSIKYVVTGATSRSGNGKNASGVFNPGTSTITWTVKDNNGNTSTCTTQVIVSEVAVSIPDVFAVNPGGEANTIYIGYGPTSLTLTANPSGGTGPYTYLWSTGATTKSITVNPNKEGIYPYLVYVVDSKGCAAAMIKFIRVVDIRCGNNKVEICHVPSGNPSKADEICVSRNAVEAHLAHGDYLGSCRSGRDNDNDRWRSLNAPADVTEETPAASPLNLRPNPSKGQFEVQLNSSRTETAQVMVLNANGTVIESRTVQLAGKAQTLRFDLSRQASGIYLVKIVTGSGVRTEKVVIQK
jgi:hypothetical protein